MSETERLLGKRVWKKMSAGKTFEKIVRKTSTFHPAELLATGDKFELLITDSDLGHLGRVKNLVDRYQNFNFVPVDFFLRNAECGEVVYQASASAGAFILYDMATAGR